MPGTTSGGLPYPFSNEQVGDGAANIEALARAVEAKFTTAVASGTRGNDDLHPGGPATGTAASVTMGGHDLTGKVVLLLGTLVFRVNDAPANVFITVRIGGAEAGSLAIGSVQPSATDTVTTITGVGVSPVAHPVLTLTASCSAGSTITLRQLSRIVGVGGFAGPITAV